MKICQIVASSGSGGLEKHVLELCNEMAKTEQVSLIAPPEMREQLASAVTFIPIDFNRSRYHPLLLWDVLRAIRAGDFDIVHSQASKASSVLATLQAWIPGVTVGTIHNNKAQRAALFAKLSAVIAVSHGASAIIPKSVPVSVVYNGVKTPEVGNAYNKGQLCALFNIDRHKPLLCSVARLVPAKGFDLLIEAMAGVDANLLIVGDGILQDTLQAQIDRLQLQTQVKLAGHRNDALALMAGVDGVIIASRNEGFSYVFAEALLLGKAILSTDVPVANEILDSALIMPKNAESIRAKLNEWVFAPAIWHQRMAPAWACAQEKFSLEAMAANTLAVYRTTLTKRGA